MSSVPWSWLRQRLVVSLLFFGLLLVGLAVYRDYGLSWDEETSRLDNGRTNYLYIMEGDAEGLFESNEKYHGPAFEIILYGAERLFQFQDSRTVYLMRHLATFLLFYASVVVFYRQLRRRFDCLIGLAGTAFLVLSPRIFADAFYNSKDLALLSAYIFALATLERLLRRPTVANAVLHALACGFLIDIRIVGIVVPVLTCFLLPASWMAKRLPGESVAFPWRALLCFPILTAGSITLFWPVLWQNPPQQFYQAFEEMRHYPWPGSVFYRGEVIKATQLPWHYLPWWMLITTPPFYTLLFAVGVGRFLAAVLRGPIQLLARHPEDVAWVSAFFLPLGAVIYLHSTVYDGWRHMYFVYPAFLYLAVLGLVTLLDAARAIGRRYTFAVPALLIGCYLPLMATAWGMVRDHPYQMVYFNYLAGPDMASIKDRYDFDYWGLSCREGMEKLLAVDQRPVLTISGETPAKETLLILRPEQRARFRYCEDDRQTDYFLTHFRFTEGPPAEGEVCTVTVGNASLFAARKLRSPEDKK